MNRLTHLLLLASVLTCGALLTGCTTTDSNARNSQASANPYAGGNGAFGEDPVNPGQYASAQQVAQK